MNYRLGLVWTAVLGIGLLVWLQPPDPRALAAILMLVLALYGLSLGRIDALVESTRTLSAEQRRMNKLWARNQRLLANMQRQIANLGKPPPGDDD